LAPIANQQLLKEMQARVETTLPFRQEKRSASGRALSDLANFVAEVLLGKLNGTFA
jgi:hypothetical protein